MSGEKESAASKTASGAVGSQPPQPPHRDGGVGVGDDSNTGQLLHAWAAPSCIRQLGRIHFLELLAHDAVADGFGKHVVDYPGRDGDHLLHVPSPSIQDGVVQDKGPHHGRDADNDNDYGITGARHEERFVVGRLRKDLELPRQAEGGSNRLAVRYIKQRVRAQKRGDQTAAKVFNEPGREEKEKRKKNVAPPALPYHPSRCRRRPLAPERPGRPRRAGR